MPDKKDHQSFDQEWGLYEPKSDSSSSKSIGANLDKKSEDNKYVVNGNISSDESLIKTDSGMDQVLFDLFEISYCEGSTGESTPADTESYNESTIKAEEADDEGDDEGDEGEKETKHEDGQMKTGGKKKKGEDKKPESYQVKLDRIVIAENGFIDPYIN